MVGAAVQLKCWYEELACAHEELCAAHAQLSADYDRLKSDQAVPASSGHNAADGVPSKQSAEDSLELCVHN